MIGYTVLINKLNFFQSQIIDFLSAGKEYLGLSILNFTNFVGDFCHLNKVYGTEII